MKEQNNAPNSLAHFLGYKLYSVEDHRSDYDKFVYDIELVHYPLLTILLNGSPAFAQRVLGLDEDSCVSKVMQGSHFVHPFDLEVAAGPRAFYFEVKLWDALKDDQFARQTSFLREDPQRRGIYLLSPLSARPWSAERIAGESAGLSRLLTFSELSDHLEVVSAADENPLPQIADAYRAAIRDDEGILSRVA